MRLTEKEVRDLCRVLEAFTTNRRDAQAYEDGKALLRKFKGRREEAEQWRKMRASGTEPQFRFEMEGTVLYAPDHRMTIGALEEIAIRAGALDVKDNGYEIRDSTGRVWPEGSVVDLYFTDVFHTTEGI